MDLLYGKKKMRAFWTSKGKKIMPRLGERRKGVPSTQEWEKGGDDLVCHPLEGKERGSLIEPV